MKIKVALILTYVLILTSFFVIAEDKADSGDANDNVLTEIKDAQNFLSSIYALPVKADVEHAVNNRIKIGDTIIKHRGLLSEAIHTSYNPYSNRFVFEYNQSGKPRDPGGQGYWVLIIETDDNNKVVTVSVGIAKK